MEENHYERWPFNLLCRIFDPEELKALKTDPPADLSAFLIYTVRDLHPEIDAEMILLHFMEKMTSEEIASKYNRPAMQVSNILAKVGERLCDPALKETYRKGLIWRIEHEKQTAYLAGFRKGYFYFFTDLGKDRFNRVGVLADPLFNLPGHNHPVEFLGIPEELSKLLYYSRLWTIKQVLDADEKKLLTEYKLEQNEVDALAQYMKAKGYNCPITRIRQSHNRSSLANVLLRVCLSETVAAELKYDSPSDMLETFEFVLNLTLTETEQAILKMHYLWAIPLQEIAAQMGLPLHEVYERTLLTQRKLRDPKFFGLIRYGLKTTVRELLRMESECGFQDGLRRAAADWHLDEDSDDDHIPESILDRLQGVPIDQLELSFKTCFRLRKNNVETIADLVRMKERELLAIQGLGRAAVDQIRRKQWELIYNMRADMVTAEISSFLERDMESDVNGGRK